MSTTLGVILEWPVVSKEEETEERDVTRFSPYYEPTTWYSERELGGFYVNIPNIYPAVFTQPYDADRGGVLFCPPNPVDGQVWQAYNTGTSDKEVAFDANNLATTTTQQFIVHPITGEKTTRISLGGSKLATRWYFADWNDDGSGDWEAIPNLVSLAGTTTESKPQIVLLPAAAEQPTSNGAAKSSRSTTLYNRPVLLYDDSTDESAAWTGVMPDTYSGGPLSIMLAYASALVAVSGDVRWAVSIEAIEAGVDLISTDNFGADNVVVASAPPLANTLEYVEVPVVYTLTPGQLYRVKVTRDADDATDTMIGDVELHAVYLREL